MEYTIRWLDDSRDVLVVELLHEIDYPMLLAVADECLAHLDAAEHPVRLLVDLTRARTTTRVEIHPLGKIARHPVTGHPRRAHSYVVSPNGRVKILLDLVTRLIAGLARHVTVVSTLEAAWHHIEADRPREMA